jgi:hypothetical protein
MTTEQWAAIAIAAPIAAFLTLVTLRHLGRRLEHHLDDQEHR